MSQIYIARQPIFDTHGKVFAYELLWRTGGSQQANVADGDLATSQVTLNALTEFGLDKLVGREWAFINLTRNFITGEMPLPNIASRVVVEVLEDIKVDAALIAGIEQLKSQGYLIALDDFIYHPSLNPLVALADVVKIDLMALDSSTLEQHVQALRQFPLKLLAEKIETQEEYQHCLALGFDYFQGYFFARPNTLSTRRTPVNKLAVLQLLAQLNRPESNDTELENIIVQDVTLSYRLLRFINSALYGLPREVDSIRHAVALLGRDTLRHLVNLVFLARFEDKPEELMITAMIRARMCELLGDTLEVENTNSYFTAGLFSVLDAMMDQPMSKLLPSLPLSDELKLALLKHQGQMGKILAMVIAYNEADWKHVYYPRLDANQLRDAYFRAIDWANETACFLD